MKSIDSHVIYVIGRLINSSMHSIHQINQSINAIYWFSTIRWTLLGKTNIDEQIDSLIHEIYWFVDWYHNLSMKLSVNRFSNEIDLFVFTTANSRLIDSAMKSINSYSLMQTVGLSIQQWNRSIHIHQCKLSANRFSNEIHWFTFYLCDWSIDRSIHAFDSSIHQFQLTVALLSILIDA